MLRKTLLVLMCTAGIGATHAYAKADAEVSNAKPTTAVLDAQKSPRTVEYASILSAETAMQRGDYDGAARLYLDAYHATGELDMLEMAVRSSLRSNDMKTAQKDVDEWLAKDDKNPDAKLLAAHICATQGDMACVKKYMQALFKTLPDRKELFRNLFYVLAGVRDGNDAVALMTEFVRQYPQEAAGHYELARLALKAKKIELAKQEAQRASDLKPNWEDARLLQVQLLMLEEKPAEALKSFKNFARTQGNKPEQLVTLAKLQFEAGKLDDAEATLKQIPRKKRETAEVQYLLGLVNLKRERLPEAKAIFTRIYEDDSQYPGLAWLLGMISETEGQKDEALSWYSRVYGSGRFDASMRMAMLYAQTGQVARGRALFQQLRQEYPEQADAIYLNETGLLAQGNYVPSQELVNIYDKALKAYPDNRELRYGRAISAANMGNANLAEQDLRILLKAQPDNPMLLNALGYTLADLTDRYDEASTLLAKALQFAPREPAILDSWGWLLFRQGRFTQSLPFLEEAYELFEDPEVASHLGEAMWMDGQQEQAWQLWQQQLKLTPENDYLRRTMDRYRERRKNPEQAKPTMKSQVSTEKPETELKEPELQDETQ